MKARVAASIVLALAVAVGTAGCGLIAPQATTKHYDPSDGVGGSVGAIDVRNAFIVTDGVGGKVGNLVVTLVNTDSKSHRVAITSASSGGAAEITVEPGQVKKVGTQPDKATQNNVFLTPFDALPGSLYPVYFQYGDATGVKLNVPVLDGGLPAYTDLVPPTILPAQN
ncbi:hypothetical protein ASF88_03815 [Leifsonia sp. Leaf336]|uniref:hypothetical protein n=1 Tax=Leifsonia sp. Leaf336 TaxID=1736341 RepID=UPI0006F62F6B|nr:hypothetical protein [Leifsonia sp. Leaf336]KQR53977.1 hypothetical protein ASF88_03815 [Leifsonia sp. Leaf336]